MPRFAASDAGLREAVVTAIGREAQAESARIVVAVAKIFPKPSPRLMLVPTSFSLPRIREKVPEIFRARGFSLAKTPISRHRFRNILKERP
jgi:hypothetical protein